MKRLWGIFLFFTTSTLLSACGSDAKKVALSWQPDISHNVEKVIIAPENSDAIAPQTPDGSERSITNIASKHFFVSSADGEANLRSAPTLSAERLGSLPNNAMIIVSLSQDSWLKIDGFISPSNQHALAKNTKIHTSLLTCESTAISGVCTVNSSDGEANLRDANNAILLVLKNNDKVLVESVNGEWATPSFYARLESIQNPEKEAWIHKNLSSKSRVKEPQDNPPNNATIISNIPYRAQRDNIHEPGATCGITSATMLLRFHGDTVEPDFLYETYGKSIGQSPSSLESLYRNRIGNGYHSYNATYAEVRKWIDAGQPVVMHGWFTYSGHVVLAVGYDSTGLYFHDPAGKWTGGISTYDSTKNAGRYVHYSYDSLTRKFSHPRGGTTSIFGSDGELWISTAK